MAGSGVAKLDRWRASELLEEPLRIVVEQQSQRVESWPVLKMANAEPTTAASSWRPEDDVGPLAAQSS